MVADMLRLAAVGAYDILVLLSGDADHAPAIDGVRALGKQAYVASWGGAGVSQRIRRAAFDHVDLLQGLTIFERSPRDEESADLLLENDDVRERAQHNFLEELRIAEQKFDGGYVGLGYFVTRWRSSTLDPNPEFRRAILDLLVDEDSVEIYDAPDGAQAIRTN